MASISSTSSTSSSLGNTALRGFGGLSSGLDRDSLIEQMTAGTTAKITAKQQAMTKLQWKQEAYRSISGKILDLQDTYMSYTATKSLKNSDFFAKSKITATGNSDYTKYITASGKSEAASRISVRAVKNMATSATMEAQKTASGTNVTASSLTEDSWKGTVNSSKLAGLKLSFGTYSSDGKFNKAAEFTFPTTYQVTNSDGTKETKTIDYTLSEPGATLEGLKDQLNAALDEQQFLGKNAGKAGIHFSIVDNKLQMNIMEDDISDAAKSYTINSNSSAIIASAMGVDKNADLKGASLSESIGKFNEKAKEGEDFLDASLYKPTMGQYLKGTTISITYGSQTKQIDLVRDGEENESFDEFKTLLQKRIDQAFGSIKNDDDSVTHKVEVVEEGGALSFKVSDSSKRIEVSADTQELRNVLGIKKNQSNMVTTGGSLWDNRVQLGFGTGYGDSEEDKEKFNELLADFTINGEKISGLTADTTVEGMLSAINKNKYAGVTAAYISGDNKFVLTSNEMGSGREIDLGGAAEKIFGGTSTDGQDAQMEILYNGVKTTLTSTSNTFEIDGLKLTASSTFDASATGGVSFTASANVDDVTERVKQFIEDYNALIQETRDQVTTRPDSDYSPLTDDQKKEMDETSIKNWEDKAKEGILFNSTALKDMNISVQSIFATMMQNGISYDDLESIGITASDDYSEGGKLIFDEDKFKSAMETDPDLVSDLFTGNHGIVQTINDTLKPYATRYASQNGGSYGSLIEEAGSDKLSLTLTNNSIYTQLKEMEEAIASLKTQLSTEQDRYIQQFTTMETLISQMNTQSSYLSQLAG